MKMALRRPLLVVYALPAAFAIAAVHDTNAKAASLRGQRSNPLDSSVSAASSSLGNDPMVQSIGGHYFGLHFSDSPFAVNPWVVQKSAKVVDDMDPVAPFDRMDRTMVRSWSGAAQVAPGQKEAAVGYTQPDFVPPYLHPKPFPKEEAPRESDGVMIPIEDQTVVAHEDRLRIPGLDHAVLNPLGMYPLVAPADKINPGPHPVAVLDAVPGHYDKFFDQTMQRDAQRLKKQKLVEAFKRVDTDNDNAISPTEFDAEIKGHQKKNDDQAQVLWKQYHTTEDPDMSQAEFEKMAKTGFDLGQKFVNRSDMSATLTPPDTADAGFWGGGAACPEGKYVKGVQIKVQPYQDGGDNTALNALKFKCEDGSQIQTAEGSKGAWTGLAECLEGQKIYSVSVRIKPYTPGQDNSGINDLKFKCRSPGQDETTTLMFGPETPPQEEQKGYIFVNGQYVPRKDTDIDDKQVVVGKGEVANGGGWTEELTCGANGALCGAQGRLSDVEGAKDNMGITDFRFFCCSDQLDCSEPCKQPTSTDCKACQAKEQGPVPAAAVPPQSTPAP